MVLVILGTFSQVHTGIVDVQKTYFHSFFLYWSPQSLQAAIPVFPGGFLVGGTLVINLLAAHFTRFRLCWQHCGILCIHGGLLLLIIGEFGTALFSVESQLALREGEVRNYTQSRTETELAVVDLTPSEYDQVVTFPEELCASSRHLRHKELPFTLHIRQWIPNSHLKLKEPSDPSSILPITQGLGTQVYYQPKSVTRKDNELNIPSCILEIKSYGRSLGTWLVSLAMPTPQEVRVGERTYEISLRHKRYYFPFSIYLEKFTHEKHPGTEIPSHFSSLVSLYDEKGDYWRQTLIYMNQPLRLGGKSFYQASFGENDTLSVLQVVDNPSRLVPYIACAIIVAGLCYQVAFGRRFRKKGRA